MSGHGEKKLDCGTHVLQAFLSGPPDSHRTRLECSDLGSHVVTSVNRRKTVSRYEVKASSSREKNRGDEAMRHKIKLQVTGNVEEARTQT